MHGIAQKLSSSLVDGIMNPKTDMLTSLTSMEFMEQKSALQSMSSMHGIAQKLSSSLVDGIMNPKTDMLTSLTSMEFMEQKSALQSMSSMHGVSEQNMQNKKIKALEEDLDEVERSRDKYRNSYNKEKEKIAKIDPEQRRLVFQDFYFPFEAKGSAWVE